VTNDISPTPAPKGAYGKFTLKPLVSIFEKVAQRIKPVISDRPLSFEDMDINTGFVLYETILTNEQKNVTNPVNLTLTTVRDRAIIYLDMVEYIKILAITYMRLLIHNIFKTRFRFK